MTIQNYYDPDDLISEAMTDIVVRVAARENGERRKMAVVFEGARHRRGWSMRKLAEEMHTSLSQVQRLLHKELGGSLTLRTLYRAADVLGLDVTVRVKPKPKRARSKP